MGSFAPSLGAEMWISWYGDGELSHLGLVLYKLGSYRLCSKFLRLSLLTYMMGGYYSGHFEVLQDPDPQSSEYLE